jgi:repressor LexA
LRKRIVDIPVYGTIPAGFAEDRKQEAKGCVSVDMATLGVKPTARTFALEVRGDSMIGKHILEGDLVVLEHGMTPRNGDVVAALIDNESTLKTFLSERGKPFLRAENPKYPKMIPASELVIQGVMVALVRKRS